MKRSKKFEVIVDQKFKFGWKQNENETATMTRIVSVTLRLDNPKHFATSLVIYLIT